MTTSKDNGNGWCPIAVAVDVPEAHGWLWLKAVVGILLFEGESTPHPAFSAGEVLVLALIPAVALSVRCLPSVFKRVPGNLRWMVTCLAFLPAPGCLYMHAVGLLPNGPITSFLGAVGLAVMIGVLGWSMGARRILERNLPFTRRKELSKRIRQLEIRNRALKQQLSKVSNVGGDRLNSRRDAANVLGIDEVAAPAEVKRAFKRQALNVHPDHGGTDWLFHQVDRARSILMDTA